MQDSVNWSLRERYIGACEIIILELVRMLHCSLRERYAGACENVTLQPVRALHCMSKREIGVV